MLTSVIQKIQTVMHHQGVQKNLGWMDTLANLDELDALRETTVHLAKIKFNTGDTLKRQLDVLLEIDQKSHKFVSKISHKYLNSLKLNKTLSDDIYTAVYQYQRQLYVAYTQFLDFYLSQKLVVVELEKLNLTLARQLNATFAMTKWRYFDDQPAPAGTWNHVCKVIKCAENLSILNSNLFVYDFEYKETSLAAMLEQGFMLDTLQKSNYSRMQIQLAEQILKRWATNPVIATKFQRDNHHFFINTDSDKGPERIRAVEKFADYRFWRVTRMIDMIEAYLCAVDTNKALAEFGLESTAPTAVIVELFKKLRVDWCTEGYERQRRKQTREKKNKLIHITYGLDNICRLLGSANAGLHEKPIVKGSYEFEMKLANYRSKDLTPNGYQAKRNNAGSENWWLVDESAAGFGVDLGKSYSDWIEVGKLIAYTTSETKTVFVIAEIKSIRKQTNGHYRAGLEVIGTHGSSVKIGRLDEHHFSEALNGYYVDDSEAHMGEINTFDALMLSRKDDASSNFATLILPRSEYKRGSKVTVKLQGSEKVLEMGVPIMKQREWVRVAIPVLNS
jgi:hypothetical protein